MESSGRLGFQSVRMFTEADEVGSGGGEDMLDVCSGQAAVAASAQAVGMDGFRHGCLASGACSVFLLPGRGFLLDPGVGLDLLQWPGQ